MSNKKGTNRILYTAVMLLAAISLYLIGPRIVGMISASQNAEELARNIDLAKHFVLTIFAVISVHLIDLWFLRKDIAQEYDEMFKRVSETLTQTVTTRLEMNKETVFEEQEKASQTLRKILGDAVLKIDAKLAEKTNEITSLLAQTTESNKELAESNRSSVDFYHISLNAMQADMKELDHTISLLKEEVNKLEGLLLRIDYLKVGNNGVTEATIYHRAIAEVSEACKSIDVFTSYLLEEDGHNKDNEQVRGQYFDLLLKLCEDKQIEEYRRIVQTESDVFLEKVFGGVADAYLNHIKLMEKMEFNRGRVHPRTIDKRRPTTYVIIDKKVLLWQINQISKEGKMQMYAMYIVEDPTNILIRHFINEFEEYYEGTLADHPKLSSPLR